MAQTGARSSAIMAAGTLVSRILGFVKQMLLGVAIGTTANIANIFALSNTLPNMIYVLIAGGVFNAVLVPQIIKASKQPDGGADYISRLMSLAIIGLACVTTVVVLLAHPIIALMGVDWSPAQTSMGATFALWCFPQIFFYGLYTVVGQVLNAREAFGWYMWAPVVNNVVAIATLLVFIFLYGSYSHAGHSLENWTTGKTFWLAGAATIGVALQALVLFIPLRALRIGLGVKFGWRGIGLGTAAKIASWTLLTGVVANLSFLFLARIASIPNAYTSDPKYTVDGIPAIAGNASLDTSTMLYQLPHGVIGLSIATVLFNRMARASTEGDHAGMVESLSRGLRLSSVATIFCSVALVVFAGPIGMLFSGGVAVSGAVVGQVITVIALGGPFLTTAFMMGRMFYANEDARTPLVNQTISAVLMVLLGLLVSHLAPQHVVFGIALLYAGQNVLATLLYHRSLKKWLGDYDLANIVRTHLRVSVAAVFSAAGGFLVLHLMGGSSFDGFAWRGWTDAMVTILVGGLCMGLLYLVFLKVFQVRELDGVAAMVKARLGRGR